MIIELHENRVAAFCRGLQVGKKERVCALRVDAGRKLSAVIGRRHGEDSASRRVLGVRSFRATRFFSRYVELTLELADGAGTTRTTLFLTRRTCGDTDKFRRLRQFLLRTGPARDGKQLTA